MIRRNTLLALLFAAAACGGEGGGDDEKDAGSDAGGSDTSDGGGTKLDAAADTGTPAPAKPDQVTNAGTACSSRSMCTGENPNCMTSLSVVVQSIPFPGGYCSATCKSNIECGDDECPVGESLQGAPMLPGLDIGSFLPSNCFQRCTSDSTCRTSEGYRCASILDALSSGAGGGIPIGQFAALLSGPIKDNKYCLPPAPAMPEAGPPDAGAMDSGAADTGAADTGTADTGTVDAGADAAIGDV